VPINDTEVPPYPTDAMGDLGLPDLGLPDLTDGESEDAPQGRGLGSADAPVHRG
jgi:hypothetical protein